MDECTDGDFVQGKAIAYLGSNVGARDYSLTYFKAIGCNHVGLLAVCVVEQGDTSGTVGVVLDALNDCGDTVFVSLKVDEAEFTLVAAAAIAGCEVAGSVASAGGTFTDGKRFLWCSSSDCSFEYTNNFVSLPRCRGLEFSYCHFVL